MKSECAGRASTAGRNVVSRARRSLRSLAAIALLAGCARAGASTSAAAQREAERVIRRNTQALLDAIAPGDTATWNRLLDPDAIIVDENDVVRGKQEMIAALKPLGAGLTGNLVIDDFRMALHGDIAVVTHEDNEYLDYHGQVIRSRFRNTEVWKRHGDDWREISSMILAVLKDPPAIALDRAAVCAFNGRYAMTADITATLQCSGDSLVMKRDGRPDRVFLPETRDVFFEPGQPRTRRIFQYDANGRVTGFVDRREARDIAWSRTSGAAK